jgi:hypothetical protein
VIANLLEYVVALGIVIYGMRRFLVLRKYWQYRHEQVATESISVLARILSLGAALPFLIKFVLVDKNVLLTAKELVDVTITGSILLIGTGLWLKANRGINPIRLLLRAVQQERREALHTDEDDETRKILARILHLIERHFSADQKEFYKEFATKWHLPTIENEETDIESIIYLVDEYLALKPPIEQAAQLKDLLSLIFWSQNDNFDELTVAEDVIKILQNYVGYDHQSYELVIVAQNSEHSVKLDTMLQSIVFQPRNGGAAYVLGKYHSKRIAEVLSLHFVKQDLFSIVEPTQLQLNSNIA